MNITNFKRVVIFGLVNFWRNKWLSLAASLVLALTLITLTFSVIQNIDIQKAISSIKDKLDMTVYLNENVSETEVKDLQLKLTSRSDIKDVAYVSKDEALKIWQSRPASQRVKELITPDNNPLPRSLHIKTETPESLETIAALLKSPIYRDKIERVSYEDNRQIIQDLIAKNNQVRKTGLASSLTFVIISLIVLINTIRTMLVSRREEIEIMRLVGASNFFVKGPFLIEAILTALFATIISLSFLIGGIAFKLPIIPSFISNYFGELSQGINVLILQNIVLIFVLQLAVAFFLTVATTFISLRRYLRG